MHYDLKSLKLTANREYLKILNTFFFDFVLKQSDIKVKESLIDEKLSEKFVLLSYHDTEIIELLSGLGYDMKKRVPYYSSIILVELW